MSACIFCKMLNGEVPVEKVYEDDAVIGFKDINPLADLHILFIHRQHHSDLVQMMDENSSSILAIMKAIVGYAHQTGIDKTGFRVVTNIGKSAGQSVFHAHFHVLSHSHLGTFGK